jgi:hypothetical protein|nr:MAG TPA: hypothetical protein [Caudoviricetes sp.]
MERSLLEAFNYMNETNYTTLEEIKQKYTEFEILDCWLMYEGIHGYTNKILEILKMIRFGERTERERKISETPALMMQFYYDMADEGIVYPISSDKVDSVVLAKEIAEMAIDFENGKYEKFDWLEEVETYVRDHFIWSEYVIKGED